MLRAFQGTKCLAALRLLVLGLCAAGLATSAVAADAAFRTWSDSSGKFKIKAKLVGLKDGVVTLEKEDGTEIELPLAKLSSTDQKEAQKPVGDGDSPFATKSDTPFGPPEKKATSGRAGRMPGRPGRRIPNVPSGQNETEVEDKEENLQRFNAPISRVKQPMKLPPPNGAKWKVPVPAPPKDWEFSGNLRSAPLPKKNHFESISGMAINVKAQKVAVGFVVGAHGGSGQSRIVIANLKTGKSEIGKVIAGSFRLLALSDDGKMVLVNRAGAGHFGKGDKQSSCEIWKLNGAEIASRISWRPFEGEWMGGGEANWGEFFGGDKVVMISSGGMIGVWKLDPPTPLYALKSAPSAVPALSPDRKLLAFTDGFRLDLIDLEKKKVLASAAMGAHLAWPALAFSPSGKQICCLASRQMIMGDVATGKIIGNLEISLELPGKELEIPRDDFLLVGKKNLVNMASKTETWKYLDHDDVCCAAGWTFFASYGVGGSGSGALVAMKIPQPAIQELVDRAKDDPTVFALKEGTTVKLDLSGLPASADRGKVTADLTANLERNKCKVGDAGTVTLFASMEGPKETTVDFNFEGSFKFQEVRYEMKIVHEGVPIWITGYTNTPHGISYSREEGLEAALRRIEKIDYGWYGKQPLPKYLRNLGDVTASYKQHQEGFGFGQSRVTPAGLK